VKNNSAMRAVGYIEYVWRDMCLRCRQAEGSTMAEGQQEEKEESWDAGAERTG